MTGWGRLPRWFLFEAFRVRFFAGERFRVGVVYREKHSPAGPRMGRSREEWTLPRARRGRHDLGPVSGTRPVAKPSLPSLPAGAATVSDLTTWELRNARALVADRALLARLLANLMRGAELRTTFSGVDCAWEALLRGVAGLRTTLGREGGADFVSTSTCDIGKART